MPHSSRVIAPSILDGIKVIIFDLDGTLYNQKTLPLRLILARPREIFLIYAERRARKALSGSDYGNADLYFKAFFDHLSRLSRRPVETLREWYFVKYMPLMCRILQKYFTVYPGIQDMFDRLKGSPFSFGVYSDYPSVSKRLESLRLDPARCGGLFGPEDFGAQKPAPRPFLTIATALGGDAAGTLVVGDREDTDGAGAKAAGMRFFRILPKGRGRSGAVGTELNVGSGTMGEFRELLFQYLERP